MAGTGAGISTRGGGYAELPATVDLQPVAPGTWTDTGARITLPAAGTYQLDAMVRGYLQGVSPVTASIQARLWDETAGAAVPQGEVWVGMIGVSAPAGIETGGQSTASLATRYAVPGPRVLRLEAARQVFLGATATAGIVSNGDGRTLLRWERIG